MINAKSSPYSKALVVFLTIVDCFLFFALFRVAYWLEFKAFSLPAGYYQALLAVCLLGWVVSSLLKSAYHPAKLKSLTRITKTSLNTLIPHAIIVASYVLFVDTVVVPVNFMIMVHALFLLVSIFAKYGMLTIYSLIRNRKKNRSRTIIIGYTNAGRELYRYFRKDKKSGFEFLGFFDDRHDHKLISGKLSDVKDFCIQNNINEIYFALPSDNKRNAVPPASTVDRDSPRDAAQLIKEMTEFADNNFIHFGLVQDLSGLSYDRLHTYNYGDEIPVISYTKTHTKGSTSKIYDDFSLKIKNLPFSS